MISETTTTHCIQCGQSASLASMIPSLGRCPKCYERFTTGRDPKAQIPTDTLVLAGFSPGLAADLTSWETQISPDGTLKQTIRWYGNEHGRKPTETCMAVLTAECVLQIVSAIEEIDRLGIANLNQLFGFDDTEYVHIIAPEIGFHASLAPYTFARLAAREPIAERALAGLNTFRNAWDIIEAISPYSTSMHWKTSS